MKIDIEPREIFYQRTGNLSQETAVNKEVVEQFMRIGDLRRDIVIVDSDKKPEASAVRVGSDVLAWQSFAPLSELTKIIFSRKKFHETSLTDDQYRVKVHDLIIQDDIRQKGYQDRDDYNRQYFDRLRTEVKAATCEVLRWEKLGLRDQFPNYFPYFLLISLVPQIYDLRNVPLTWVAWPVALALAHAVFNQSSNIVARNVQKLQEFSSRWNLDHKVFIHPCTTPREGLGLLAPLVPVDKWFKGRSYLVKHGQELIISRN